MQLKSPMAIAKTPTKMKPRSKSATKRIIAKAVFFLVVLPLLLTIGWFAAPYISSRLPEVPVAHTIGAGISKAKARFFTAKANIKTAIEEEVEEVRTKVKDEVKVPKKKEVENAQKEMPEEDMNGGDVNGYLEDAKKRISSWFEQLTSLFGW